MPRIFSQNIKYLRQNKGISQQELADKLGLDRSSISRWENGEMDITVGNAIQLADFFNIPIEDFTGKDLSNSSENHYSELDVLFDKHKDILTESDINIIKAIIEERKREIDREHGNME